MKNTKTITCLALLLALTPSVSMPMNKLRNFIAGHLCGSNATPERVERARNVLRYPLRNLMQVSAGHALDSEAARDVTRNVLRSPEARQLAEDLLRDPESQNFVQNIIESPAAQELIGSAANSGAGQNLFSGIARNPDVQAALNGAARELGHSIRDAGDKVEHGITNALRPALSGISGLACSILTTLAMYRWATPRLKFLATDRKRRALAALATGLLSGAITMPLTWGLYGLCQTKHA